MPEWQPNGVHWISLNIIIMKLGLSMDRHQPQTAFFGYFLRVSKYTMLKWVSRENGVIWSLSNSIFDGESELQVPGNEGHALFGGSLFKLALLNRCQGLVTAGLFHTCSYVTPGTAGASSMPGNDSSHQMAIRVNAIRFSRSIHLPWQGISAPSTRGLCTTSVS